MRALFASAEPAETQAAAPAVSGWEGLPGWVKLGGSALVVGGVVAAIVLPGILGGNAPPKLQNQEPRPPSKITDYQPPPAPDGSIQQAAANTGNMAAPRGKHVRAVPTPTPMALYTGAPQDIRPTSPPQPPQSAMADAPGAAGSAGVGGGNNALTESVTGATSLPTMHATLVRNRSFMIDAGDAIQCLPVEAKNTSRPGFVTCRVPQWYRSSDQRRGLLPPGTRIFGQIRTGLTSEWEPRLGVLYTRIETPWFKMDFAAPGADAMGRAGEDVDVHTFFWSRAGSVALYALMDASIGIAQGAGSAALSHALSGGNNNNSLSFNNFGGQAQGLASQEMQHQLSRPPVGTRDPALPVVVTVGQDLDFSAACRQAMQVDPMACPLL